MKSCLTWQLAVGTHSEFPCPVRAQVPLQLRRVPRTALSSALAQQRVRPVMTTDSNPKACGARLCVSASALLPLCQRDAAATLSLERAVACAPLLPTFRDDL